MATFQKDKDQVPIDVMIEVGKEHLRSRSSKTLADLYEEFNLGQYGITLSAFKRQFSRLRLKTGRDQYVRNSILKIIPAPYKGKPTVDLVAVSKRYYDLAEQLIARLENGLKMNAVSPKEFYSLMCGFSSGMREIRALLGIPENARMSARMMKQAKKAPPERLQFSDADFIDENQTVDLNGKANGENP